ncbi:TPA: dihydroorotate dehydrogenase electron transfer subunit [Candidatus Micrarchaeota archaeon]|nr:dihydroorotate dehydrogenase electron transfer subunit [Candidatus Micrarchaeota archaeon]
MSSYYTTAKIKKIRKENYRVNTIELDCSLENAQAGQFVMLWFPRLNEKPMCVVRASPLWLSVAAVGDFTNAVDDLKEGDVLSFRGPLGKGFWFDKGAKSILLVGGGYGVAALNFLANEALKKKIKPVMVIGARKKEDIIFKKDFEANGIETLIATDDGGEGFKGRAHELAEKLLAEGRKFDCFYACGPEKMMQAVARVAEKNGIESQLALERYMGCGLGICGKCDAGGELVCKDGPVMTGERALKLAEFGICHRDTMGHKVKW